MVTGIRKRSLKRETESLLIAAQNNAIRTNYIKEKIGKTQKKKKKKNSKCRLCSDKDETINHMISECSKLAQKEYKTRYDWVGKVIPPQKKGVQKICTTENLSAQTALGF